MTDRVPAAARAALAGQSPPTPGEQPSKGRQKRSVAPASRAFAAGISLAATTTIIAALALSAPAPVSTDPATVELTVTGAAGAPSGVESLGVGAAADGTAAVVAGAPPQTPSTAIASSVASSGGRVVSGTASVAPSATATPSAPVAATPAAPVAVPSSPAVTSPPTTAAPVTTVAPAPVVTVPPVRTRAS